MSGTVERLSTHVLDTVRGRPAAGIPAVLEGVGPDGSVRVLGHGSTDTDGRVGRLNRDPLPAGEYRIVLSTGGYFAAEHGSVFFPTIAVQVLLDGAREHYHVPVLVSTYSYSTYLGS
ncbi:hydroxyisourate hydrolase [Nakamurella flavida]|uniref:5-hydroxyisourate hydrolase n=1 Tax=Nakamurella flavida TaxID=363630 RepID=A0A938YNI2_9ACTN|nr:hydroxyisourate hydrolase [Nakamurella flavida]MBM9477806.1 hydroxyisourate hydrolase [Nakamurella flavida]MDP9779359.1 5-hydroxyisourate hydrolase [Nakamurella flavida]